MASHTIKVTGVSDELLELLDERIKDQHASGRAEYIRELIRKDVLAGRGSKPAPGPSFREVLSPVHEEASANGYGEAEVGSLIEEVRDEAYRARLAQTSG